MNEENIDQGEGFSSVDLIYQCLIDKEKFNAFEAVLKNVVSQNSKVLDIGTGSGILALTAARLGAKEVTAVEFDPVVAEIANNNFKQNNLGDKIKIVTGDARSIDLSDHEFDIIIMELLATGLVDEMQVEAINNLVTRNLISKETVVIPFAQDNYLTLAETDFSLHGFNMKMIKHLWSHDEDSDSFKLLSEKKIINRVVFNQKNERNVSTILSFKTLQPGTINSVCLTSKIIVDEKELVTLDSTHSLNPIVFIPLPEKTIEKGQEVKIELNYLMGGGFNNFKINYLED